MKLIESAFESLHVNDLELVVEGELRGADRTRQYLLVVRRPDGTRLLARCLRADEDDLEYSQRAASSVRREVELLGKLDRPELPKVHPELSGNATLVAGTRRTAALAVVREFIAGMQVDDRLARFDNPAIDQIRLIIPWLESVLRALIALHAHNAGHFDLRASNVIDPDGQGRPAVLIDLNSSQVLRFNDDAPHTILYVDERLAPKQWYRHLVRDRGRIDLKDLGQEADLAWLDWYQFGLLIRHLVQTATSISSTNRRYLEEVANYLTNYPECTGIKAPEIHRLLERAKPEFLHPYGVPELVRNARNAGVELFPDGQVLTKVGVIGDIVRHPAFTRLFAVKQLTLLRYVFVGAEHTRAMHMMHCASITADLLEHMFSEPRFRRTFESRDVQFAIVAALLHDINHFPFLHTFQESAGSTFTNRALFDDVMDSDFAHFTGERHQPLGVLLGEAGIDREALWRVCFEGRQVQRPDSPVEQFVNSMLESGVDVDKLSYLALDALYTGVPMGRAIDVPRLMRSALMTQDRYDMEFLAFEMKALPAVESVIQARLANFRSIYWHPRNRALMAMFLHVAGSVDYGAMDAAELRQEFLISSETDVIRRMNALYHERTGQRSPMTQFLALRGAGLYEELYQVPFADEGKEEVISQQLTNFSRPNRNGGHQLLKVRRAIGAELSARYPRVGTVDDAEVLIDVPSRPMDGRISAFLRDERGKLRPINEVSSTARAAVMDFQQLAKSIRIFAAPRVAAIVAPNGESEAAWLGGVLFDCLSGLRDEMQENLS